MTNSTETTKKIAPVIPNNIYPFFEQEREKTEAAKAALGFLKITSLLNQVKKDVNILHESLDKKSTVYIFGAGGTTSWFLPKLLKIYNDAFNKVPEKRYRLNIVLIDADVVETKNLIRQNFISEDIGQNKAKVLAERYSNLYRDIEVSFIPKYATYSSFDSQYLPDNKYEEEHFVDIDSLGISHSDILINLVDNEGFKKKLDVFVNTCKCFTFAAGVNLFNGQAYFSTNHKTNGYVHDHADLLEIFDEVSVHACADTDANGTDDNPEQLFNGNDVAASVLANLYQTVLTDIPLYKRINFVTGNNMNVSCGEANYSTLLYWMSISTSSQESSDERFEKAKLFVSKRGLDVDTPVARMYYQIYHEANKYLEFTKMFD